MEDARHGRSDAKRHISVAEGQKKQGRCQLRAEGVERRISPLRRGAKGVIAWKGRKQQEGVLKRV